MKKDEPQSIPYIVASAGLISAVAVPVAMSMIHGAFVLPGYMQSAASLLMRLPWLPMSLGTAGGSLLWHYTNRIPQRVEMNWPKKAKYKWSTFVGRTFRGRAVWHNWITVPHGKVSGVTGGGKSGFLRWLIISLAMSHTPDELEFLLLDFKDGSTLIDFSRLPHVSAVCWDYEDALAELTKHTEEVHKRGASNRDARYNFQPLPAHRHVFIIVDEGGEIAPSKTLNARQKELRKDCMNAISFLARIGREPCYHVVFGTQRPSNETLPTDIRGQLEGTFAFRTENELDSEIVIRHKGAESLPQIPGRMLYKTPKGEMQVQAPYVSREITELWIRAWDDYLVVEKDDADKADRQGGAVVPVLDADYTEVWG